MVVLGISHSSCISSIITVNLKGLKLQISAFYCKFKFSCNFNKTIIEIFMITMIMLKKLKSYVAVLGLEKQKYVCELFSKTMFIKSDSFGTN